MSSSEQTTHNQNDIGGGDIITQNGCSGPDALTNGDSCNQEHGTVITEADEASVANHKGEKKVEKAEGNNVNHSGAAVPNKVGHGNSNHTNAKGNSNSFNDELSSLCSNLSAASGAASASALSSNSVANHVTNSSPSSPNVVTLSNPTMQPCYVTVTSVTSTTFTPSQMTFASSAFQPVSQTTMTAPLQQGHMTIQQGHMTVTSLQQSHVIQQTGSVPGLQQQQQQPSQPQGQPPCQNQQQQPQMSPHSHTSSPEGNSPSQGGTPTDTPSPSSSSNSGHHQHVVHVHISPGETFTVRVGEQIQHIQGPATVRMVSNNGPPLPMPMQVSPGHMVQQIVDENGILTHMLLSPQPHNMMGSPMTGGPNNAPQYYPPYGGGPYQNHPGQYPSPHHSGGVPRAAPHMSHQHGTPPPATCNNHGTNVTQQGQGPSPPLNSMDDRTNKRRSRLQRKHVQRQEDGLYRERAPPSRNRVKKGVNNEASPHQNSVCPSSHNETSNSEIEEERRAIQQHLSSMPLPKVTEIVSRSALIQLSPPEFVTKEYEIDPGDFCYELHLCEKGRDGKYKTVYRGDATEITLKDLKPATEYHLKVCTILDDLPGLPTEAISFKTISCEPDLPQPPEPANRTKTSIMLKWKTCCENGSKITAYLLESEQGDGSGSFVEVYNGLQRQYRVAKLTASTKYTFRLAAINGIGRSDFCEPVTYCTSGSVPSVPDPPMLSEVYVTEFVISWIKRPNDDAFLLQLEDEISGHGFIPVYNGPLLSHRISNLRRNKEFRFRLAAKNEEGVSPWSDIVAYKTLPARPDAPAKPQIKGKVHAHVFRITWDPPRDDGGSEITKYIVELDDGKGYETMYEGSEREHTCDRLTPGQSYKVRVACCSLGGRSDWSDFCTATTQAVPPGQCSAPKLQGKPKATSLHLRWAIPEYNGGASVTEFAAQMILPDNTSREVYKGRDLDCIVAGLSPGRPYLFQVRSFNRAGGGPWSEPLEVVSGAGVPDPPKMAVCNCRTSHSVNVTWEGPVNNGATITDYRLEWQLRPESDFSQLYYGPNTSFEVKGLSPAMLYTFRVQAVNSAGPGLYSPVSTMVTPPSSPSSVLSIRAVPSATSALVQWREPHNNGSEIYSYNLDTGDKQLISISAVTEYTIEELVPETTYKVRIQAVNGIGVGAFSSPVKFTTRALPPSPPKLECAGVAPNSLKLKWGDGRNTDLITYTLEMDREDGNFQEVYRGQAYSCKVNRLLELTSYDFRIYASNDAGSGPYSEVYTFSTTKAPPPALRAPRVDHIQLTSCDIEWVSCRPMGTDSIVYLLQLQARDQEYKQIYRGTSTSYSLENLHPKTDYQARVCAIRQSSFDNTELVGAFSPGCSFTTASPEPVKSVVSRVTVDDVVEPKQLSDQQLAAIFVAGLMFVAVLFAFIAQQFISYTSGPPGRHDDSV